MEDLDQRVADAQLPTVADVARLLAARGIVRAADGDAGHRDGQVDERDREGAQLLRAGVDLEVDLVGLLDAVHRYRGQRQLDF